MALPNIKHEINQRINPYLSHHMRTWTPEEMDEFLNGRLKTEISELDSSQAKSLNYDNELSNERLTLDMTKFLGSGEFGFVVRGIIKGNHGDGNEDVEVAVKSVKPNVEVLYFKAFLSEIEILTFLGHHENLVSLLGTFYENIDNREVFMALEFCAKGDLLEYLRENQSNFYNQWENTTVQMKSYPSVQNINELWKHSDISKDFNCDSFPSFENSPNLSTLDLLKWSLQISNGMNFISSKQVIHGDLAARNVLLTFNNVAKITDFGLSRQVVNYSNNTNTTVMPLPWRWLAIETLKDMIFSPQSDIWSFGVTLWEIFTLGQVPHVEKNWDNEFISHLVNGHRLHFPELGSKEVYNIMQECWQADPTDRISFPQITNRLENIISTLQLTQSKSNCKTMISS